MFNCSPGVDKAIPQEYRKVTANLFPPEGYPAGKGPAADVSLIDAAIAFAELLGIGTDYKRLLKDPLDPATPKTADDIAAFLGHFQNNLVLLIQKTWVEKADEARKEKLLDRLPDFIGDIERENYQKALTEFGCILEELAWLFFGPQTNKDDFTEYTLRIDTQMGLFWWYGGQISRFHGEGTAVPLLKALLLIGICYLTNF